MGKRLNKNKVLTPSYISFYLCSEVIKRSFVHTFLTTKQICHSKVEKRYSRQKTTTTTTATTTTTTAVTSSRFVLAAWSLPYTKTDLRFCVSISPIFYEQLFRTKVLFCSYILLLLFFWQKIQFNTGGGNIRPAGHIWPAKALF